MPSASEAPPRAVTGEAPPRAVRRTLRRRRDPSLGTAKGSLLTGLAVPINLVAVPPAEQRRATAHDRARAVLLCRGRAGRER